MKTGDLIGNLDSIGSLNFLGQKYFPSLYETVKGDNTCYCQYVALQTMEFSLPYRAPTDLCGVCQRVTNTRHLEICTVAWSIGQLIAGQDHPGDLINQSVARNLNKIKRRK